MKVQDTAYHDLVKAVEDGEADQTILFSCKPAWHCLERYGDRSLLWESNLHRYSVACLDRKTGLRLEL